MDDPVWNAVSDDAKDLIAKLLTVDPTRRLKIDGVLEHPWMAERDASVRRQKLLGTVSKMRESTLAKHLPMLNVP